MDDVEYILRLVLKARDEMAAVLAKARKEVKGFATDANSMNTAITNLNAAMDKFDGNLGKITDKLNAWRASLRETNADGKDVVKTLEKAGKTAESSGRAYQALNVTQKQLQASARAMRNEIKLVADAHDRGIITTELALSKYKKLGKGLDEISLKMSEAARTRTPAHVWVDQVEEAITELKRVDKLNEQAAQKRAQEARDWEALIKRVYSEHADAAVRAYQLEMAAEKQAADQTKKDMLAHEALIKRVYKEHADAAVRAHQQETKTAEANAKRTEELVKRSAIQQERLRIKREGGTPAEVKALADAYAKLARAENTGSKEARIFANESERLRLTLRVSSNDTDRFISALGRLDKGFQRHSKSAAGFDNEMRGTGILFAVASMNELISTAIALGGELVSLAGSAAMAGGALGGILAAGASQALPVLGLLVGAASRAKAVMDAFQQSQTLDKAKFTDAEKAGQKSIDQANQLANASDAVAAANDNLAESRDRLTQAQKDGTDQLEDLIYAEKSAALAARGASLNVKEAQKALADAIREGASALEIEGKQQALDQARLSKGRAGTTLRRATRDRRAAGGDIGNLESVKSAAKAVEDAEKAVEKANRGLDQAADKADRAASTTMTAAANLEYLLSQLSPAERKLLTAFKSLYNNYKQIFIGDEKASGIYGVITNSFTRAVERVNQIIQQPDVIKSIQGLANATAEAFNKVTDSFSDTKTIDQFQRIMANAAENMGPLVDGAIKLGHAFLDISEAANPALQKLLEYLGKIIDKFVGITGDQDKLEEFFTSGEKHLESWLDLLFAVIDLFAVLVGASADSGKRSIDDLTEKIKGWTDWLEDHREDVVKFFEDARVSAYKIGAVLEHLATVLFNTFTPDRVEDFARILNEVLIPAFEEAFSAIGTLTDAIAGLLEDYPFLGEMAKWAVAIAFVSKIAFAFIGFFTKAVTPIVKFIDTIAKASKGTGTLARVLGTLGKFGVRAIPFVGWAAAIATVLQYFGLLDDAWDEIKQAAMAFWGEIEPPIQKLMESIGRLVEAVQEGKGAFSVIMPVLREFFEIIVEVGGFLLQTLAKSLGQMIGGIIDIISGFVDVVTGLLTGDFKLAWEGLKGIVGGVLKYFMGMFRLDFFLKVGEKAIEGAKWLGEAIVDGISSGLGALADMFVGAFMSAWRAVLRFFGVASPSKLAMDLGSAILDGIVAGFKAAWNALGDLAGWAWEKISDGFRKLGGAIRRTVSWIWDKWVDFVHAEIRGFTRIAEWVWDKIKDGFYALGSAIRKVVKWIWDKFTDFIKAEIRGFKNIGNWIFDTISDSIHNIGGKLESIGKRLIDAVIKGIKAAPKVISDAIDWLLDKVPGGGAIKKGLQVIGSAQRAILPGMAEGGPVSGSGSGDTVVARLTPGEHVLTKAEVQAAGGHAAIFALRALLGGGSQGGPYGYQAGGMIIDPRTGMAHGSGVGQQYDPLSSIDYEAAAKRAAEARKKEAEERKKDLTTQREDYKKSGDERAEATRVMWNDILTTTRRFANDVEEQIRDMRVNSSKTFARMSRDIPVAWGAMWYSLMKVTHEGLHYIGHETNKALTAMGEKHIDFHLTAPSTPSNTNVGGATTSTDTTAGGRYAAGGWIGMQGQRGRDTGRYALGAGEAVLNFAHQPYVETALNNTYGFGLGGLFNLVRGFHAGGPGQQGFASGKLPDVMGSKPGFAVFLALFQKLFGSDIYTMSGSRPGSRIAGSGNISNHSLGNAIDISNTVSKTGGPGNPPPQNALDRLHAFIAKNIPKPPRLDFLWRTMTGGNHFNHIHLGLSPAITATVEAAKKWIKEQLGKTVVGEFGGMAGEIASKVVEPRNTATARLVQAALNRFAKAANVKLAGSLGAISGSDATGLTGDFQGGGTAQENQALAKKMAEEQYGWRGAMWNALQRLGMKESGWLSTALNPSSGAFGIGQFLGGTKATYAKYGATSTQPGKQINAMLKYIKDRYGDPVAALNFHLGHNWYAEGGVVPGGEGTPIPIMAHAGEWILNKGQQLRAAMLSGLSVPALKSMLGFWGGGGSFAGGGEAKSKFERVKVPPVQTFSTLMEDMGDVWDGVIKIADAMKKIKSDKIKKGDAKKVYTAYDETIKLVDIVIGAGGIPAIAAEIAEISTRAATTLKKATFQIGPGGVVRRALGEGGVLAKQLSDMVDLTHNLVGEKGVILANLNTVNKKLKEVANDRSLSKGARDKLVQQLTGPRNNLLAEQLRIEQEIRDSIEDRFNQQLKIQQNIIDTINARHEGAQGGLELAKRYATAFGNESLISTINQQLIDDMQANVNELQAKLAGLRAANATDLAKAVEKQIADLQVEIYEAVQQQIKDAVDAVSKAATRQRTALDLVGRMADALGVVGNAIAAAVPAFEGIGGIAGQTRAQVAQGRVNASIGERAGIADQLRRVDPRNVGLIQELTDKINELTVAIAEGTRAEREARFTASREAFDYSSSINDLETQLIAATDAAKGTTSTNLLLTKAQDKLALYTARSTEIELQLAEARAAGDTKAVQDLTVQLLQNQIAVQNNTKAVNDLTGAGSAPSTFASSLWEWFNEALFTGTGGIMPRYMPPGGVNMGGPGNIATLSSNNNTSTFVTNIEVNEAGQPIDVDKIAGKVVFAQSTAYR